MKQKYFKSIADYDIYLDSCTSIFFICATDDSGRHFINVVTDKGETPKINGEDSYCDALGDILKVRSALGKHHCVKTTEIKWKELPDNVQKIFNYTKYRKEHPLKLKEIDPTKVYRTPLPSWVKDEEKWLEWGSQPFDHIIGEGGLIHITGNMCPICGSTDIDVNTYNNLCPEHLAGSAGHVYTCKKCGYSHREVTIMS